MSLFQSLLYVIKNKIEKESSYKKNIAEHISDVIKVKIIEDQIKVKDGVLIVTAPATIKMAVMIKKEEIKSNLKKYNINISSIV